MKKLTMLFVIGYLLGFSIPLVWGQGTVYSPADFNAMLEGYKLKLTDPQKCPPGYVTAIEKDKYTFGTTPTAYPDYNGMLEAYGVKIAK